MKKTIFIIFAALSLAIAPVFVPTIADVSSANTDRPDQNKETEVVKKTESAKKAANGRTYASSISLSLPFNVPSHWSDFSNIKNGAFIPTSDNDTWFIYGLFGPLQAVSAPQNPKYKLWGGRHNGIDFAAREGLPVLAVADGKVIFTGNRVGLTIVIQNGLYQITYGHLSALEVKKGRRVNRGEIIGYVGHTGTINPHLHLEVDQVTPQGRLATNPFTLFKNVDWSSVLMPDFPANRLTSSYDMFSQPGFLW